MKKYVISGRTKYCSISVITAFTMAAGVIVSITLAAGVAAYRLQIGAADT